MVYVAGKTTPTTAPKGAVVTGGATTTGYTTKYMPNPVDNNTAPGKHCTQWVKQKYQRRPKNWEK